MSDKTEDAGVLSRILSQFPVNVCVSNERMEENIRSAIARGLPQVCPAKPHDRLMSIAAGGPSLEDTWKELDGVIVAVNGSLGYLLGKGVTPWACGIFDPRPHVADLVEPHPDVLFFLGSTCHPRTFDKLKDCQCGIWHPLGMPGVEDVAKGAKWFIGGGTTMGLRWLNIGHFMGFRRFHAHGLDSSFRGDKTHAYPDYRDGREGLEMHGYRTSMNFIAQVRDWFEAKEMFASLDDRPTIRLFGDGLLQHLDKCSTLSA